MKYILSFIAIVFLCGCGTAPPQLIERTVPVPITIDPVDLTIPLYEYPAEILLDDYTGSDSMLHGKVLDSLNKVIAELTVDLKNRIARLNMPAKYDTVYVALKDEIPRYQTGVETVALALPWYLQAVWFAILGILLWLGFKGNLLNNFINK